VNNHMSFLEKLVDRLLNRCFGKYRDTSRPSKDDIADQIDRRLGDDNGRDDGKIISHKRNGYRYYITRSPIIERGD
jgi:hypothetical protein